MQCTQPITINQPIPGVVGQTKELEVPCGQCLSCRLKRRAEWALRFTHELDYYADRSSFVTLTYSDNNIPSCGSLVKRHAQLFIKRIRKTASPNMRYFLCGEYGSNTRRPHYHVLLLGNGLSRDDRNAVIDAWPMCDWKNASIRNNSFGLIEPQSIRYVVGYVKDKITGDNYDAACNYLGIEPEFRLCSTGIGKRYALANRKQIIDNGYIMQHGVKYTIPRYYLKVLNLDASQFQDHRLENEMNEIDSITGVCISKEHLFESLNTELITQYLSVKKRRSDQSDLIQRTKQSMRRRSKM